MDVPDGFLHEWWLMFGDMFNASQPKNPQQNEGSSSSSLAEQMMNMGQHSDPSPSRQHELHVQMIRELTVNNEFGSTIRANLVPSMGCPVIETEQNFQGLTSSQAQSKELTSAPVIFCPLGNLGDIVAQEIGSSVHATPSMENIASNVGGDLILPGYENNRLDSFWTAEQYQQEVLDKSLLVESGRKRKNSIDSDGSSGMPRAPNCHSEISSPTPKYLEDTVKLSSSHVNGTKDGRRTYSCNSLMNHTTHNIDDSKDKIPLGGILGKNRRTSF